VAGLVEQTPNAIGYVELIYAIQNHLNYGTVENSSHKFIKASLATVTDAASGAAVQMRQDIRISITDASGANAYPICSFTYLLIPAKIANATKRDTIKDFLHWMLTTGQTQVEILHYARLPQAVVGIEERQINEVQ
jgi:phosphate transport system substrate-binding protein